MGVCIYYNGKIKSMDLIDEFCEEVEDIAKVNQWKYDRIDITTKEGSKLPSVKGILMTPPDCETVSFVFNEEGKLVSLAWLSIADTNNEDVGDYIYFNFFKTQFAGVELHIQLVKMLKFLYQKYFDEWECTDDAKYYETGDLKELERQMGVINRGLAALNDAFEINGDKLYKTDDIINLVKDVFKSDNIEIRQINSSDNKDAKGKNQ